MIRLSSLCNFVLFILAIVTLSACANHPYPVAADQSSPATQGNMPPVVLPPKVTAIGYGALPTQEGLSTEQRRLLAMRASKLDAYRSLAETVAGLKITGNTTISAVTITNDSFRVYVEAYLRGARVLTLTPMPGGSYETVLELTLGGDFYRDTNIAVQGQPVVTPLASAPATPGTALNSTNYYLAQ